MQKLDRRGITISAIAGLVTGLVLAWVIWRETAPPREVAVQSPPTAARTPDAAPAGPATDGAPAAEATAAANEPAAPAKLNPADVDLAKAREVDGHLVQELGPGREVTFTVMPTVQATATSIMRKAEVSFGAVVAMDPHTGRILALAEHSSADPSIQHLALKANPPAASVFKLITTVALLESAGLTPDQSVCYHGGLHGLTERHLVDDPKRDTACQTMTEALGHSTNAVYGKLAHKFLTAPVLQKVATAFGWERDLPFLYPVEPSRAVFSDDRVKLAKTAAGFYDTHLSPLHAALVAGALANDGLMMAPQLVERFTVGGKLIQELAPAPIGRSCEERTARTLARMMVTTTETGTAGPYFRKRGKSLEGIRVAGKTGSLSAEGMDGQQNHFSWWVGFAPAENPRIALAAVVVNVGTWRIKGTYLAREVLESYFEAVEKVTLTSVH